MNTGGYAVRDSVTMPRRNLLHAKRYPVSTTGTLLVPILLLLAFGGLFGNTLGAGLGVTSGGATDYADYLTPAIFVIAAASGALSTALSVNLDMTAGIINRFRTMAISRASVLTGHVLGSVIQTVIAIVLVIGVALLIGFRPNATAVEWLAAAGLLALSTLALTWPAAAAGLAAKGPEGASNIQLLAFLPILAAGSSHQSRCRPGYAGSPSTSRSPRSSRRCGGCWWAPRSATTRSSRSPGASASR